VSSLDPRLSNRSRLDPVGRARLLQKGNKRATERTESRRTQTNSSPGIEPNPEPRRTPPNFRRGLRNRRSQVRILSGALVWFRSVQRLARLCRAGQADADRGMWRRCSHHPTATTGMERNSVALLASARRRSAHLSWWLPASCATTWPRALGEPMSRAADCSFEQSKLKPPDPVRPRPWIRVRRRVHVPASREGRRAEGALGYSCFRPVRGRAGHMRSRLSPHKTAN
jgi:hypothetical protein